MTEARTSTSPSTTAGNDARNGVNPDSSSADSLADRHSGEDAVRRAASVVINRGSSSINAEGKRVRRRSRRRRQIPILNAVGLKFHYVAGIMLSIAIVFVFFSEKISMKIWRFFHAAPPPGAVVGPPPWWFRVELPALLIGLCIWLYLTPGFSERLQKLFGLRKDRERRSRRRHS
jgi:hypothetical protein